MRNASASIALIVAFASCSGVSNQSGRVAAVSAPLDGSGSTQIPGAGPLVRKLENEIVGIACGVCIDGMEGGDDCPLAAEMGDKQYYFVRLQTKDEFDTHGEGLCEAAARAKITGELHEHGLIVSSIELVSKSKAP